MSTHQRDDRVTIGKVLKPRGIRGEVKVLPLTDVPDRFEHLPAVYLRKNDRETLRIAIDHVSYYKGFVYLHFAGYDSREKAEELLGCALQVDQADSPPLPEGVYYHFEIIDCKVYTEEGQYLGIVADILETGSHDVYIVRHNSREYLIPSTQEVVRQIDCENKRMTVHLIEGLLDL